MASDTDLAHKSSSRHRQEVLRSDRCGCFYCLAIFEPAEIVHWVDRGETAMCPKCDIDAVIGSASGWSVEPGFLKEMHWAWFKT